MNTGLTFWHHRFLCTTIKKPAKAVLNYVATRYSSEINQLGIVNLCYMWVIFYSELSQQLTRYSAMACSILTHDIPFAAIALTAGCASPSTSIF
jgi:hypothetical protein